MSHGKSRAEITTTAACMRATKAMVSLATAARQEEQAAEVADVTRIEAVRAMAAAIPLLTAEQREQLRPILAGSIPADTIRADSPAA